MASPKSLQTRLAGSAKLLLPGKPGFSVAAKLAAISASTAGARHEPAAPARLAPVPAAPARLAPVPDDSADAFAYAAIAARMRELWSAADRVREEAVTAERRRQARVQAAERRQQERVQAAAINSSPAIPPNPLQHAEVVQPGRPQRRILRKKKT